jgi:AraC-like DNA-binding protein
MHEYAKSGAFGEVMFYLTAISKTNLESVDRINSAGWHNVNELYRVERLNGVFEDLIMYTRKGCGYLDIDRKRFLLTPHTAAIVPARASAVYGAIGDEKWEFVWMHYSGNHAEAYTRDLTKDGQYVFEISEADVSKMELLIKRFLDNRSNGLERLLSESKVIDSILHLVLSSYTLGSLKNSERSISDEIILYIENAESLSLEDLSKKYHYTKEHIVRIFKKATGMTPYKFWQISRIKRSCDALVDGKRSVEEIALAYGFKSVSNYYVQFKQYYGVTPSEYRKMHGFET